ncbi:MAG: DUF1080 domain-containing protein [Pirellulales bacterium]
MLVSVADAAEKGADEKKAEQPFNGKDLSGWVVEGTAKAEKDGQAVPNWYVDNGEIHCVGKGFGFLRYDKSYADFRFSLEYKLAEKGNSGIGIRGVKFTGKSGTRPSFASYELQILDDGGKQPNTHATMSLYRYVAPKSCPACVAGEWNHLEIECRGPKIRVTLNDVAVQDVDQSTIDEIKNKPLSGYLSLQCHGSVVAFRNLKVVDLGPPANKPAANKPAAEEPKRGTGDADKPDNN